MPLAELADDVQSVVRLARSAQPLEGEQAHAVAER